MGARSVLAGLRLTIVTLGGECVAGWPAQVRRQRCTWWSGSQSAMQLTVNLIAMLQRIADTGTRIESDPFLVGAIVG